MEKITFEAYKEAVLQKFDQVRQQDKTSLLVNLTPASFRNYCLIIADGDLTADDEKTLRTYFDIAPSTNLQKGIDQFGLGKMKSVISFLNGENDSHNSLRTELAAVLSDFRPRPYTHFIKKNGLITNDLNKVFTEVEHELPRTQKQMREVFWEVSENGMRTGIKNQRGVPKKIYAGLLAVLFLVVSGYIFKSTGNPECLQWADDHFEVVECVGNVQGFMHSPQLKYDERLLDFRKIKVCDTTTFFKYGKPVVWYLKKNGNCEFFNAPGVHPVYDRPLKPISDYIVRKYIMNPAGKMKSF